MSAKTSTEKVPGGKNVLVEFEDQIAWVTLNRPEKRNCMSEARLRTRQSADDLVV
jgi:trans-feruloyl-CoA hydratase/vanillin synthase